MKNSVRSEAQQAGIGAIVVAVAVLILFFFLSRSGLGSGGAATPEVTGGASAVQSIQAAPSPAAT